MNGPLPEDYKLADIISEEFTDGRDHEEIAQYICVFREEIEERHALSNPEFNIGDCARLISGGPVMTIVSIGSGNVAYDTVKCCWHIDNGEIREAVFHKKTIRKV